MSVQTDYDPWGQLDLEPQDLAQNYIAKKDESKDAWDSVDFKESFGKSILRKIFQIPKGLAQVSGYGLLTNLMNMISAGEALDEDEIERIRDISERENIPFDEEKFRENYQQALKTFPTINNLASGIENYTGLPLEAKDEIDKFIEFSTSAGKLTPEGMTFRGMNIGLPKPVLGLGVGATSEALKQVPGMPDWLADLGSFAILKQPSPGAPSLSLGKIKPSGIPERGFEKLTEPRQVSAKKFQQINEKLESDFKNVFDEITKESPVGETFENLKNNPLYKQQTQELLNEAQTIANDLPGTAPTKSLKKEYADIAVKRPKGIALGEYDKNYLKYMQEGIKDVLGNKVKAGQIVEQYRKNNSALSEYYEPGASKALNRAKRDALLDQNRAIANFMEKAYPNTELVPVFKEGNARWSKIMEAEAVDSFIDDIFSGDKIDFKNIRKFFDKEGYTRVFKHGLGEKGFKNFETLMQDMLGSETPYKMLKVAKEKGWNDLVQTAGAYLINPSLGKVATLFKAGKQSLKFALDSMLDKPQIGITWKKGIDNLKKGNFSEATKNFEMLKEQVEIPEKLKTEPKPVSKTDIVNIFKQHDMDAKAEAFINSGMAKTVEELRSLYKRYYPKDILEIEKETGKSFNEIFDELLEKKKK